MSFVHETESAFQRSMYIAEVTWGTTPTGAQSLLKTVGISPKIKKNRKEFTPKGMLLPTIVSNGREWTEADFDGLATYEELPLFVANVVSDALTTPITRTYEIGAPSGSGVIIPGCVVTGWKLEGDTDQIKMSGSLIGKKATAGTLAASGTEAASVWAFDASSVTIKIAGTAIGQVFKWNFSVSDLWAAAFFIGSSQPANVLQKQVKGSFGATVEANATNLAYLSTVGEQTVVIECINVVGTATYTLRLTFQAEFLEPDSFSDEDGVYAIGLKATLKHAATAAVTVVCTKVTS